MQSDDINTIYRRLCTQLSSAPKVNNTRELTNVKFTLTNLTNNIATIRGIDISYLFGELLWYIVGSNDVKFISKFAGLWEKISDDGETSNSAYGHILQSRHKFNQIEKVIELLSTDKVSRRAVLNFNVPNENVIETKDEICTIALQFYIRDNQLHCTAIMRSNDIYFGLPYDVAFFTELQKYIANRLNIEVGTYTHFAVSLHVYDKFYSTIKNISRHGPEYSIKLDIIEIWKNAHEIYNELQDSKMIKSDIIAIFDELKLYKKEIIQ